MPVFLRLLSEDAHVNLVGVDGIIEIPHVHAIFQRVRELLAIVLFDERRLDEIFVTLINVFRATAGALVNGVDDDVQNGLLQQARPFGLPLEFPNGPVLDGGFDLVKATLIGVLVPQQNEVVSPAQVNGLGWARVVSNGLITVWPIGFNADFPIGDCNFLSRLNCEISDCAIGG